MWRPCATRQVSCLEKMRPARSARTRRRLRVRADVRGVDYGTTGELHFSCRWFDCSDDPVRHNSSPSRRDVSRQVVSLLVSSNANCRYRTPRCPALRRRVSSSTRSLAPRSRCRIPTDVLVSLVRSPNLPGHRRRYLDTGRPSPYRYEPSIQLRLESVANAHTAADLCVRPWFSNRADLQSRGRREQQIDTPSVFSDNPWIRRGSRLFATVAVLPTQSCESKVLNQRTDSRVSQTTVQYQKFFIENLHSVSRRSFFQSLFGAMCISNSRDVIFRDYFCRVTPLRNFQREMFAYYSIYLA